MFYTHGMSEDGIIWLCCWSFDIYKLKTSYNPKMMKLPFVRKGGCFVPKNKGYRIIGSTSFMPKEGKKLDTYVYETHLWKGDCPLEEIIKELVPEGAIFSSKSALDQNVWNDNYDKTRPTGLCETENIVEKQLVAFRRSL